MASNSPRNQPEAPATAGASAVSGINARRWVTHGPECPECLRCVRWSACAQPIAQRAEQRFCTPVEAIAGFGSTRPGRMTTRRTIAMGGKSISRSLSSSTCSGWTRPTFGRMTTRMVSAWASTYYTQFSGTTAASVGHFWRTYNFEWKPTIRPFAGMRGVLQGLFEFAPYEEDKSSEIHWGIYHEYGY